MLPVVSMSNNPTQEKMFEAVHNVCAVQFQVHSCIILQGSSAPIEPTQIVPESNTTPDMPSDGTGMWQNITSARQFDKHTEFVFCLKFCFCEHNPQEVFWAQHQAIFSADLVPVWVGLGFGVPLLIGVADVVAVWCNKRSVYHRNPWQKKPFPQLCNLFLWKIFGFAPI